MSCKSKLLFLVAEDWYFCSHRLSLAVAAMEAGYDVVVVTRVNHHAKVIHAANLRLIPLRRLRRSRTNLFQELATVLELWSVYHKEKPDLVHHVGLKPIIYGSLVARFVRVGGVVNALAGLGFVFSSSRLFARLLRPFINQVFSYILKSPNSRIIVQNQFDLDLLTTTIGVDLNHVHLIRGAGVDLSLYSNNKPREQPPLVVLIARMLWDKGVGDFVEAATRIRKAGISARFVLVGMPDSENPTSLTDSQLLNWHYGGNIEWWGFCADVPRVLALASIVCLPTYYGEGLPKALIEAMASSRAIITTTIPGCRELVTNEDCGILVPPRDVASLTAALELLIQNPDRCTQMGLNGRKKVEQSLSLSQVLEETLDLYLNLVPVRMSK